ncbi:Plant self-incompatibility S1 [Dillenia turbinata]|uniref:S-protein homolog n=1 Tax=Dillenia turbinata TaxID=194707 RepID=A0AAN8YSG8_9MAGN
MESLQGRPAFLLLLLVLSQCKADESDFFFPKRAHLTMQNTMSDIVDVHCKSGEDDLGVLTLQPSQTFSFTFRPSAIAVTLFCCSFKWNNMLKYFDIYDESRDRKQCAECLWEVHASGPCMFNYRTHQYDICYPWNP